MADPNADTARAYQTPIGIIDWERASQAAQALLDGRVRPDELRVLSALFARAMPHGALQATGAGVFDGVRAAQLVARLVTTPESDDVDALWSLLFALFLKR